MYVCMYQLDRMSRSNHLRSEKVRYLCVCACAYYSVCVCHVPLAGRLCVCVCVCTYYSDRISLYKSRLKMTVTKAQSSVGRRSLLV